MDIMIILQLIVLLGAIYIGVRLGGIGIGYAGGAGVLVLGLCLGMKPGNIPWDVTKSSTPWEFREYRPWFAHGEAAIQKRELK